jgi:hypothetical protein
MTQKMIFLIKKIISLITFAPSLIKTIPFLIKIAPSLIKFARSLTKDVAFTIKIVLSMIKFAKNLIELASMLVMVAASLIVKIRFQVIVGRDIGAAAASPIIAGGDGSIAGHRLTQPWPPPRAGDRGHSLCKIHGTVRPWNIHAAPAEISD